MRKTLKAAIGVILAAAVYFLIPAEALSSDARMALGILCWAVSWWIGKVTADYITALLMAVMFISFAHLPVNTVFKSFSGSSWWLLLTAFALSSGVAKTGLLKRISLKILKLFPASFKGQVLGLLCVGGSTAPFIPSLSAKSTILAPLSQGISRCMGYEKGSRQDAGLFMAMLVSIRNAAPLFISSSVLGYTILGSLPADIQPDFTMGRWFLAVLPWFLMMSLFNYLFIVKSYGPGKEAPHGREMLDEKLRELGPMSRPEKNMLCILILTMALWVTESLHGIPSYIIAILALAAMNFAGIIDRVSFRTDISWDYLVFMGIVLGLSPCFEQLGINSFIVGLCSGTAKALAFSPLVFLLGIGLITVLMRFVIVSELTFLNIFMVFLIPVAVEAGINPWVASITVYFFISPWFFLYQNPVYTAGYYAVGGEMITEKEGARYCIFFLIFAAVALALSLPCWRIMGIL